MKKSLLASVVLGATLLVGCAQGYHKVDVKQGQEVLVMFNHNIEDFTSLTYFQDIDYVEYNSDYLKLTNYSDNAIRINKDYVFAWYIVG